MKKALFAVVVAYSTLAVASAQFSGGFQINLGGGNGGSISIGQGTQAGQVNGNQLLQLLDLAQNIASRLVPFMIVVALLSFFAFLIQFIWKGSKDPAKQQESLKGMGYSVLALFLMVSIWGVIALMASILGVNVGGNIPIPGVPRPS